MLPVKKKMNGKEIDLLDVEQNVTYKLKVNEDVYDQIVIHGSKC